MAAFEPRGQRQTLAANFSGSSPMPTHVTLPRNLPPIGVFWDIENCQVPKGKSALAVAQLIRKKFFNGHREAEFMCVCDINKESKEVIQELNNAQVTVVHINATCKNAADDKLRQSMRRFADIHGYPATIVLISGDVNFAADLSDLNHRRHLNIIVLHNNYAPEPLLACAHQHYVFSSMLAEIPFRTPVRPPCQSSELLIGNLPNDQNPGEIRKRLKQLSDNCGGRVVSITNKKAVLRFSTIEAAARAKKRMDKEDVFGNKISVTFSPRAEALEMEKMIQSVKRSSQGQDANLSSPGRPSNGTKGYGSPGRRAVKSLIPPGMASVLPLPLWRTVTGGAIKRFPGVIGPTLDKEMITSPVAWRPASNDPHSKCSSTTSTGSSGRSQDNVPSTPEKPDPSWNALPDKTNSSQRRSKRRHSCLPYCLTQDRTHYPHPSPRLYTPPPQFQKPPQLWMNGEVAMDHSGRTHLETPSPPIHASLLGGRCSKAESESCFQPIPSHSEDYLEASCTHQQQPVELLITNLDQTMDSLEMKEVLLSAFRQHVMVLQIGINNNPESVKVATVKVPSMQDAQFAISQLHRRKIGFKRIVISLAGGSASSNCAALPILKSEVLKLLNDVPDGKLPLFSFRDLFERRYHQSITSAELNRMRDIVIVQETSAGRTVSLNQGFRGTPSPTTSEGSKEVQSIMEVSFCEVHCINPNVGKGWAEKESSKTLPFIRLSVKALAMQVHKLLETHNGTLPLGSFPVCYEHEFGSLAVDENGIPLEHLVAAIPGVQITQNASGGKRIQWTESVGIPEARSVSPPLVAQLALFSREVVDLLKNYSRCIVLFNKFIPAYHHHFGRRCRVADYGFTKLIELFEAIPHVVQVMGEGNKRLLTLTHRVQTKRFSADLLRVLKSQASKQVVLNELPVLYGKCLGKDFDITNYGVCEVADMLSSLAENTIIVTTNGAETVIAIPKREQTADEVERTKSFAEDVVELLSRSPHCQMSFNKFIPSYHHHFGRQCRVSDYGFTKLIELLESIPHVINIVEAEEEKTLILCEQQLLKVLADQISSLVRASPNAVLPLHLLASRFTQFHGHCINLIDVHVDSIADLLKRIDAVKVVASNGGPVIVLADKKVSDGVGQNVVSVLADEEEGALSWPQFQEKYKLRFGDECSFQAIRELSDVVQVNEIAGSLQLVPFQMLARDVRDLLRDRNCPVPLHQLEGAYVERFHRFCQPAACGFSDLASMLLAVPDVQLTGTGSDRTVQLKRLSGSTLGGYFLEPTSGFRRGAKCVHLQVGNRPSSVDSAIPDEDELLQMYSPVDLLSVPVPSCVPSPSLQPLLLSIDEDLMRFDSPVGSIDAADVTPGVSESKSLPAQDLLTATSSLLKGLVLSTPPPPARGARTGASARERSFASSSMLERTPDLSTLQMTSTPNGTPARVNCSSLRVDASPARGSAMLVQSCEDLSCVGETTRLGESAVSSQSTPTHQLLKRSAGRRHSRLAAQFSNMPFWGT